MNYTLSNAVLLRANCEQRSDARSRVRGRSQLTSSAELTVDESTHKTLEVTVEVRLAGRPEDSDGDDAFWAECVYRHLATFDVEISEKDISDDLANALATPLYFTAVNHCQQLVWNMGFSGARPPLKGGVLFKMDESSAKKAPKKRAPRKKSQLLT